MHRSIVSDPMKSLLSFRKQGKRSVCNRILKGHGEQFTLQRIIHCNMNTHSLLP